MVTRAKPTGRPHPLLPDRTIPADHEGRLACATCRLMGKPGDAHHPNDVLEPDVQQRRAGEKEGT